MEKKFLEKGYIVLAWGDAGWVRFFSKNPAFSPEDYKKMKFFAWGAEAEQQEIMKSLGYTPVPLEPTDILPSIQTGMINVVPSTGMVWIRMGEEPQQLPVPVLMNDSIWARIQQLECTSAISESKEDMIRIYPNPTTDFSVVETRPGDVLRVMDLFGRVVFEANCTAYAHTIASSDLAPGAYQVVIDRKGECYAVRWLVRD